MTLQLKNLKNNPDSKINTRKINIVENINKDDKKNGDLHKMPN